MPSITMKSMATKFDAIFGAGVLRPLKPLSLGENEKVTLEIAQADRGPTLQPLPPRRTPTTEKLTFRQIRARFKHVPGCWADDVIDQRSDH